MGAAAQSGGASQINDRGQQVHGKGEEEGAKQCSKSAFPTYFERAIATKNAGQVPLAHTGIGCVKPPIT